MYSEFNNETLLHKIKRSTRLLKVFQGLYYPSLLDFPFTTHVQIGVDKEFATLSLKKNSWVQPTCVVFQFPFNSFRAVTVIVVRDRKILPAPGTNQIAGFGGYGPLAHWEKKVQYNIVAYLYSFLRAFCTITNAVGSYNTTQYHTIPYHTIPYHTIPCHAMPCHAIPYHTIPYNAMQCNAFQYNMAYADVVILLLL